MDLLILGLALVLVLAIVVIRRQQFPKKGLMSILAAGIISTIGGCLGALSKLGSETSGTQNAVSDIDPYVFLVLITSGIFAIIASLILMLRKPKDS